MKTGSLSAPRLIRINWLDGSTTTHEGEFVWINVRIYGSETEHCIGCSEVLVHTDSGPIWLDYRYARYADDGRSGKADSPNRPSRKGDSRIRKTTRTETK